MHEHAQIQGEIRAEETGGVVAMKMLTSLKSFFEKCKRVWMVLKKPAREDFLKIAKVSAVGILIIGLLGFVISITMKIFTK